MKKKPTLTILALLTLMLTGCIKETKEQCDERYSYDISDDIEVITYKGHNYIVLSATKWCNGITHDPDCPCKKKGGEDERRSL